MSTQNGGGNLVDDNMGFYVDMANPRSYNSSLSATDLYDLVYYKEEIKSTILNGTFDPEVNGCLSLNGTSTYATASITQQFDMLSISIWFKTSTIIDATISSKVLFQLRSGDGFYAQIGGGTILLTNEYIFLGSEIPGTSYRTGVVDGGSIPVGWNNLVFNWESTQYKIYLNGVSKSTTFGTSGGNVPLLNNGNIVKIGAIEDNAGPLRGFFNGKVSSLSISRRSLNASEILANYNMLKVRFGLV